MFTTEHLNLRAFVESDLDLILNTQNDIFVQKYNTPDYLVPKSPKSKQEIKEWAEKCLFFAILTLKSTDEFVGFVCLHMKSPKNRDGILGISLVHDHWNKGYGTESLKFLVDYAFRSLALHRVSLELFEGNTSAFALYKKIGFIEEGRIRKACWIDGGWQDGILMGILEEEWTARGAIQQS